MAEAVKEQSAQLAGQATDKVQEWIGDAVRDVPDHAASLARKAEWSTQHLRDPDVRDNILLGIAGAAVEFFDHVRSGLLLIVYIRGAWPVTW